MSNQDIRAKLLALRKKPESGQVPNSPSVSYVPTISPAMDSTISADPISETTKYKLMEHNIQRAKDLVAHAPEVQAQASMNSINSIRAIGENAKLNVVNRLQTAMTGKPTAIELLKAKAAANKAAIAAKEVENQARNTELLNRLDAEKAAEAKNKEVKLVLPSSMIPPEQQEELAQRGKSDINYSDLNTEQKRAVELAKLGESYCLIGSAGSGKTTTTKMMALELQASGLVKQLGRGTKCLTSESPSIVFVSFTNQAVTNIREAVPEEFKHNCLTIHKLLEYSPVFYNITDPETGDTRKTMRYEPMRGAHNPIRGLTHIVVEESGSVGLRLFDELRAAVPSDVIWIFLGDLNQLPPVFDDAILGYKLLELPIVELLHSYRTENMHPVKLLAQDILVGRQISDAELLPKAVPGKLELVRFKDRVIWEVAVKQMGQHLAGLVKSGEFNYAEDVVLTPYGKSFGSIELNNYIAQAVTEKLGTPTYEIKAGIQNYYYAVGDIVYIFKQKGRIVNIRPNPDYMGKKCQAASVSLNRWGHNTNEAEAHELLAAQEELDMEALFNSIASADMSATNDSPFRTASHVIDIQPFDEDMDTISISQTGEIAEMYLAYCLTVHKSQGSEWNRVFCIFHDSQAPMLVREILYTAITRARQFLRIYYTGEDTRAAGVRKLNDSVFQKGILKQKIPGNTLEDKKKYFRGKMKAAAIKLAISAEKGSDTAFGARESFDVNAAMSDSKLAQRLLIALTYKSKDKQL